MSEKLATRALYEAGEARTVANRRAFVPQTLTFRHKCSFLPALYLRSGTIAGILGRKRRFQPKGLWRRAGGNNPDISAFVQAVPV